MSGDAQSFAPLVDLLTNHPNYTKSVEKLEFVTPRASVPKALVNRLVQWITNSATLQEVVIFTVNSDIFYNKKELTYLRSLEKATQVNKKGRQDCSVKMFTVGDSDLLCESFKSSKHKFKLRHLAMDGALFQDMDKLDEQNLGDALARDATTHILLLKDIVETNMLETLFSKLAEQESSHLHTLKICYDPLLLEEKNPSQIAVAVPAQTLTSLSASPHCVSLTRLYFGNCLWNSKNTRHLLKAVQGYSRHRGQNLLLEFCACRFEAGTGRIFEMFTTDSINSGSSTTKPSNSSRRLVKEICFHYPILLGTSN